MNRRNHNIVVRRLLPIGVLCAALGVLVVVVVRSFGEDPEWRIKLSQLPFRTTNSAWKSSMGQQLRQAHLSNELERMDLWTMEQAEEIIGYIELVPLDSPEVTNEMPQVEYEAKFFSEGAINAAMYRIEVGAPIDADARKRLIEVVLERSYASDPSVRMGLANTLCASGLIFEDERINDRVIAMHDDPDPMVAMNARRHYTWHTATPEARERIRKLVSGS